MIGKMRNRIVVKRWGYELDAAGGATPVLTSTTTLWAQVEDRSGGVAYDKDKALWSYDYKFKVRHNKLSPISQSDTIEYDGKKLQIKSLQNINEGNQFYTVLRLSTVD